MAMAPPPVNIFEQLKRDEGFSAQVYTDTTGNLTVGYGHNLRTPMPERVAFALLVEDVLTIEKDLKQALPWITTLSSARYGALLNMAFNCGVGGLMKFEKMLTAFQNQQWETGIKELINSHYFREAPARACRLINQIRSDQWV